MWRESLEDLVTGPWRPPAPCATLHAVETSLGRPLPPALRSLLLETDGMEGPYGEDIVWPADRILNDNLAFRTRPEFRLLYRPFDPLLFFGDNGGGDQFAFIQSLGVGSVHVWDHETDERGLVAPDLDSYLRKALGSDGEDWYR
ncbi:SMI1/KNR4 family protein [Streptomyces sp. NPDC008137]|uniref:SMI1/KNR4 family protein n=1 Tax=Streptomyces sp. NPDC008137 TaxID=3364813 RepID=UPI0036E985F5